MRSVGSPSICWASSGIVTDWALRPTLSPGYRNNQGLRSVSSSFRTVDTKSNYVSALAPNWRLGKSAYQDPTFFLYLFSSNEYSTLTCSNWLCSSNGTDVGIVACAWFETTLSWGGTVEGFNCVSIRRCIIFWNETSGRRRSTGHCVSIRW